MPWQSDTKWVCSNETHEEWFHERFQSYLKTMACLSNVVLQGETHMKGQNVSAGNNRRLPPLRLCQNPCCHIIQLCKYSPVVSWWMTLSFTARACPKVAPALSGRMRIQISSAWFGVHKYLTPNKQRILKKKKPHTHTESKNETKRIKKQTNKTNIQCSLVDEENTPATLGGALCIYSQLFSILIKKQAWKHSSVVQRLLSMC